MSKAAETITEIKKLTSRLIELSLCNEQNFPSTSTTGTFVEVTVGTGEAYVKALKNVPYSEVYGELLSARAFNFKMVDGALIQMSYSFENNALVRHRLAFFPSPDLTEFQNSPDVYEQEEVYAEVVARNVVPFPVRFDFDSSDELFIELHHPRAHLTLGQYENCRIPVSAPLAPTAFIDFILRSFYNTAHRRFCEKLPHCEVFFPDTIAGRELGVVHFTVPRGRSVAGQAAQYASP
jgi:hypothetical protein